jgi:hypothetical protein
MTAGNATVTGDCVVQKPRQAAMLTKVAQTVTNGIIKEFLVFMAVSFFELNHGFWPCR